MRLLSRHDAKHTWSGEQYELSVDDIYELNLDVPLNPRPRHMQRTHGIGIHFDTIQWLDVPIDDLLIERERLSVGALGTLMLDGAMQQGAID